jgi:AcrR family transcriptional regulator
MQRSIIARGFSMQRTEDAECGMSPAVENPMCDRIIGAAFTAFMELGYTGTSMLEIATRAKMSKRDLYANFSSRQAILLACISARAERMRLSPAITLPTNLGMLAAILVTFGTTVIREVSQPAVMAMFRLAIAEAERAPEVAETLHKTRMANRNAVANLFTQCQASGIVSPGDPTQMTEQFLALLWGDTMLAKLLCVAAPLTPAEIDRRAHAATTAFLRLYGRSSQGAGPT